MQIPKMTVLFLSISLVLAGSVQFRASAQTPGVSSCLEIADMASIADQTVAIALRARVTGATGSPVHGKLHIYTADSSTTLVFDRTPNAAIVPNSVQVDPQLHTMQPVVVQLTIAASQIKGMLLETVAPGGACAMSTFLPRRSPGPLTKELVASAKDIAPEVAAPFAPIHMECPIPFGSPRVVEAGRVRINTIAAQNGITGEVQVLVSLAADGAVTDAKILKSASVFLNVGALQAARQTKYEPQYVACVAVPAQYVFVVEYQ